MKSSILAFIIVFLVLMDIKLQASWAGPKDPKSSLVVEGSIGKLSGKKNNNYTVELICHNQVLQSSKLKDKENFRFMLQRNMHYAIRITKKGFAPRLISIHTQMPDDDKRLHRFYFDTELISLKQAKILDDDAIDFPIAVVSFDKDLDSFYYNEEYTANIKRQLYTGQRF